MKNHNFSLRLVHSTLFYWFYVKAIDRYEISITQMPIVPFDVDLFLSSITDKIFTRLHNEKHKIYELIARREHLSVHPLFLSFCFILILFFVFAFVFAFFLGGGRRGLYIESNVTCVHS